jgi:hypothetical protein
MYGLVVKQELSYMRDERITWSGRGKQLDQDVVHPKLEEKVRGNKLGFGSVKREERERMTLRSERAGDQVFFKLDEAKGCINMIFSELGEGRGHTCQGR